MSVVITAGAISTNPSIYWAVNGHNTTVIYSDTATTGLDALVGTVVGSSYNDGTTALSETVSVAKKS